MQNVPKILSISALVANILNIFFLIISFLFTYIDLNDEVLSFLNSFYFFIILYVISVIIFANESWEVLYNSPKIDIFHEYVNEKETKSFLLFGILAIITSFLSFSLGKLRFEFNFSQNIVIFLSGILIILLLVFGLNFAKKANSGQETIYKSVPIKDYNILTSGYKNYMFFFLFTLLYNPEVFSIVAGTLFLIRIINYFLKNKKDEKNSENKSETKKRFFQKIKQIFIIKEKAKQETFLFAPKKQKIYTYYIQMGIIFYFIYLHFIHWLLLSVTSNFADYSFYNKILGVVIAIFLILMNHPWNKGFVQFIILGIEIVGIIAITLLYLYIPANIHLGTLIWKFISNEYFGVQYDRLITINIFNNPLQISFFGFGIYIINVLLAVNLGIIGSLVLKKDFIFNSVPQTKSPKNHAISMMETHVWLKRLNLIVITIFEGGIFSLSLIAYYEIQPDFKLIGFILAFITIYVVFLVIILSYYEEYKVIEKIRTRLRKIYSLDVFRVDDLIESAFEINMQQYHASKIKNKEYKQKAKKDCETAVILLVVLVIGLLIYSSM
ncbi:MAG: hypothetical protein K9W45_00030 [Candidatus Heimdallarchaeum aukensis]|uniref:Uncharacterized protein n=1 Tax=Candidatus Heimdallarchaeum aukensis TaxID=2876573 RepID=A0A9Y1BL16_9ARCH|nr:MAG: hypothetical protein K9W45_00030 [Candidatus Heimdallarchaeum aukensis]